jgi:hypothetical protein
MALKALVEKLDDVPEELRTEYKEVTDNKGVKTFVLDIEGSIELHPAARVLKDELARRRLSEKAAKDELTKLAPFKALGDPAEVLARLDRIPELEAAAEGKLDENKINGLVETRIKSKIAPIERERDQHKSKVAELMAENEGFKVKEKQRSIADQVRSAVGKSKGFLAPAAEDAIVYAERMLEVNEDGHVVTKTGVGVTPGLNAEVWLQEMQTKKPHWWGATAGGGGTGGTGGGAAGENPFTHEHWNLTKQGQLMRADAAKAAQMAKSAGTSIGGPKPAPKK